jgi:hypothetical protein
MRVIVKMTPALRLVSFLLLGLSALSFFTFITELLSYILYPIYDAPSLAGRPSAKTSNHLWNIGLFSVFFLQHYIMASFGFKKFMMKIFPLYTVFERYVFNIVAFIFYRTIIRKMIISNTVLFEIPKIIYFAEAIGLLFFGLSVIQMFNHLLLPFSIKELMESP